MTWPLASGLVSDSPLYSQDSGFRLFSLVCGLFVISCVYSDTVS